KVLLYINREKKLKWRFNSVFTWFLLYNYLVFKERNVLREIVLSKLNKQKAVNFLSVHEDCIILRKEVIQPHLPIRLPCYDFTPIICPTLGGWLLTVTPPTWGVTNCRGVTGGAYKARERIHRGVLVRNYLRFRLHVGELQPTIRAENGFMGLAKPCGLAALCTIHCSTCVAQVIRGMMI